MKRLLIISSMIFSGNLIASSSLYNLNVDVGSDFIYSNSNYNAFKNEPTNDYYRTYGLEDLYIDAELSHSNGVRLKASLRPDALIERQTNSVVPTEFDTRAGVVHVAKSDLRFLNTYELSYSPNKNFDLGVGVYFDFEANRQAYVPTLEFGLNTIFSSKSSPLLQCVGLIRRILIAMLILIQYQDPKWNYLS